MQPSGAWLAELRAELRAELYRELLRDVHDKVRGEVASATSSYEAKVRICPGHAIGISSTGCAARLLQERVEKHAELWAEAAKLGAR